MPQNYEWRCKVCESPNLAGQNYCAKCGNAVLITPAEVDAARMKLGMPPAPNTSPSSKDIQHD